MAKCMTLLRCRKDRHAVIKHLEGKNAEVDTQISLIAHSAGKPSAPPDAWRYFAQSYTSHINGPVRSSAFHVVTACFDEMRRIKRVQVCVRTIGSISTL